MSDYESVLSAARQLTDENGRRLIDALWDSVPDDADAPFSVEWARETERRVAELESGHVESIPWAKLRDEALARIGHGQSD